MKTRDVAVVGIFLLAALAVLLSYELINPGTLGPPLMPTATYVVEVKGNATEKPCNMVFPTFNMNMSALMDEVVIITAGNEHFFDRLENMVASVHYWEPTLRIVVFDLGLTPSQIRKVKRMCRTEYRRFPFENYPPYMKQLRFYAWKAILIKEVMDDYPIVFWEDSGQEFRAPITEIKEMIISDGYFFDQSDTNFNHFCPQVMYNALGIPSERGKYEGLGGLHGAVLGFRRESRAYKGVLLPTLECSLKEECISPIGTDLGNYRYDQSIFSLYAYKNGPFIIRKENKFTACTVGYCPDFDAIRDTDDPAFQQSERLLLFSRRGFKVKPYKNYICYRPATPEEEAIDKEEEMAQQELDIKIKALEEKINKEVVTLGEAKGPKMKKVMDQNRKFLDTIKTWITDKDYENSRSNYGIPDYIKHLMDSPVGNDINIADALSYVASQKMGGKNIKYLELGVSVGKTFSQVVGSVENSYAAIIEMENINPTFEALLTNKRLISTWRYYASLSAPRLDNDTYTAYDSTINGKSNQVRYLSGDVRDENSWAPFAKEKVKFNIVFSDSTQDSHALRKEANFLLELDLIDEHNFLLWYDDLGGEMTKGFLSNFFALQKKFPFLKEENVGVVKARGWLGNNEYQHLNGIISSMNVQKLINEMANM